MKKSKFPWSSTEVLTWEAAFFVSVGSFLVGPIYSSSTGQGSVIEWRWSLFLANLVYLAFVTLAKLTYLKNKSLLQAPVASILTVVAASLIVPVVSRFVLMVAFEIAITEIFLIRGLQIAGSALVWHLALAYLAAKNREYRFNLATLEQSIEREKRAKQNSKILLSKLRQQTLGQIHETLSAAWVQLSAQPRLSTELRKLVDDVVRPLAKRISAGDGLDVLLDEPKNLPFSWKVGFDRFTQQAKKISFFDPFVTPIVVAVVTYQVRAFVSSPGVADLAPVVTTSIFMVTFLLGRLISKNVPLPLRHRIEAWIGPLALVLAATLDSIIFSEFFSRAGFAAFPALMIPDLVIPVMVFLLRVRHSERLEMLETLQTLEQRIQWVNSRTQQLIKIERQRLSNLVHGHIQDQIIAAARKASIENLSLANRRKLIAALGEATRETIADHNRTESLLAFLESRRQLWRASLRIKWSVSKQVAVSIDKDPSANEALQEVIREAITNAAKHSEAKSIEIQIELENSPDSQVAGVSYLALRIQSDGQAKNTPKTNRDLKERGQGLELFSAAATFWRLDLEAGKSVFAAQIPISAY